MCWLARPRRVRTSIFTITNGLNLQCVRNEKWKLQLPRTIADQPYWARKGKAPTKPYLSLKEPLLFDMQNDKGEKKNVISQHPEVAAELQKEAERVRKELGDVHVGGD